MFISNRNCMPFQIKCFILLQFSYASDNSRNYALSNLRLFIGLRELLLFNISSLLFSFILIQDSLNYAVAIQINE